MSKQTPIREFLQEQIGEVVVGYGTYSRGGNISYSGIERLEPLQISVHAHIKGFSPQGVTLDNLIPPGTTTLRVRALYGLQSKDKPEIIDFSVEGNC